MTVLTLFELTELAKPAMKATISLSPLCLALIALCGISTAHAADYSPYPKAGVYDGSDDKFERELTITADGKFTLEVLQKGNAANLRSGTGSGKLSDAPGGWDFSQGRCSMSLKRAMGGMQMKVEGCSSAWGDVSYDGKYKLKADTPVAAAAAAPVKAAVAPAPVAPATNTALAPAPSAVAIPTRKELKDNWAGVMVDGIAGKSVLMFAKSSGSVSADAPIEGYSQAAFFIDNRAFYSELNAAQLSKTPAQMLPITLPATAKGEGISFRGDCVYGKYDKVVVVHVDSYHKTKGTKSKPASAWMLDSKLQLQEIKPVTKVKCPAVEAGY